MQITLPVGFYEFHENNLLNFQLNRFYSTGLLPYESVIEAAKLITDFKSFKDEFKQLAMSAKEKGNDLESAVFFRGAEFFALGDDPEKHKLYDQCINAYQLAFKDEKITYVDVPYEDVYLHAMVIKTDGIAKGTILLHGGYDSFMQEFYTFSLLFIENGYDVILFEGPGQGRTLYKYNLHMIHEWEKPVGAILDYFQLKNVTLIGISLGGYLAARAAAFESRISRVVLFDLIYDFYDAIFESNRILKWMVTVSLKWNIHHTFQWLQKKIDKNLFAKWLILQGHHVYGTNSLVDYYKVIQKFSTKKIAEKIKQDVFVMAGEEDLYTRFLDKQMNALTHAKSKKARLYTKKEQASHHCQIGNLGLAISEIIEWIDFVS